MPVQDRSGTATPYSYISAASANQDSQVVKASAGLVYAIQVFNINAAARYLKVYDKATAPTSADTPVKRILIPASGGGGSGGIQIPGVWSSVVGSPSDSQPASLTRMRPRWRAPRSW
jgi:hypothetical protein